MDDHHRIAEIFGLRADSELLAQALTHPSYANENRDANDNQRLEFLGDAVLQLCSSELLWRRFPQADEGTLTKLRAQLVNTKALSAWAQEQGLANIVRIGRGGETSGLRQSINVLADVLEALIAASYLEAGYASAALACSTIIDRGLDQLRAHAPDGKTELQERTQAALQVAPRYTVIDSWGPAHDRWFRVTVCVAEHEVAEGTGRSKREAEQAAASAALQTAWLVDLEASSRKV